jgi:hypothetical protein
MKDSNYFKINFCKTAVFHYKTVAASFLLFFTFISSINSRAQSDSTQTVAEEKLAKKQERSEKVKKVFKFMSYFNYNDRGYGRDFSGVEKYEPFEGKTITCVDIVLFKPFGCTADTCPEKISKAQKFGNAIHFRSREWYIKGDIFFKEGDIFNPTLFADTERQLWQRRKFKDVQILVIQDSLNANKVEVIVFLQDKLSWTAALGYYDNRAIFAASTYNFFGLPNTLRFFTGVNFNKYNLWAFGGTYLYENIQSSQINFSTSFVTEKLNRNVEVTFDRNFFNLKSKWAFRAKYIYDNTTLSLSGNPRDPESFVKAKSHYYSLWLAYAVPVNKLFPYKDDKLKFLAAAKVNYMRYKTRPFIIDLNYNELFINQQNYTFGLGLATWDFYLEKNAFLIDVAEYFPRGISTSLFAGVQVDEIYGKRTSLDWTINYGIYLKKFGYLFTQFNQNGFVRNRSGEQMVSRINMDYVSKKVHFAKYMYFRQVIKGGMSLGFIVPEERYFNLNNTNGLRGFYSPTLKGSKSITLSIESDLLLDKIIALTKGMLYVFCDMGWLSENGKKLLLQSQYQYGVGAGVRIRSVDLGLPFLDFQFSFYPKGKDFGAQPVQFRLYEYNLNAIRQNNMFYENGSTGINGI